MTDLNPDQIEPTSANTIVLPRWIVYFQGSLIGVVAATFFIFGMMVGSTTEPGATPEQQIKCEIVGRVEIEKNGRTEPDTGAVVVLLPLDKRPGERVDPQSIHPAKFEPLSNPVIDLLNGMGGGVVRVDRDGRYRLQVDGPQQFLLIVVSLNRMQVKSHPLTKSETAELATFFRPVDRLIGEREFEIKRVSADRPSVVVEPIKFANP